MKRILAASALALSLQTLAACAHQPIVDAPRVLPEGAATGLGQAVQAGDVVITPLQIVEDSRCPINARCVWAGRIVVEARIDGGGWRETVPLTLGETSLTRGHGLSLVSAEPGQMAGGPQVQPQDYRFVFESTDPGQ